MFSWITLIRCLNWGTVRKTIACVVQKRLTGLAAEMAFHAVLGLFPAIIAVLTAVSLFESIESILIDLAIHFADIVPIQVWTLLIEFVEDIKSSESKSWFSFSSIIAIWIISGVLSAAINALDRIHQVAPQDKRSYFQTKAVAIYLTVLTIIFLILACFLLWVGDFLLEIALQQSWSPLLSIIWKIFSTTLAIATATATAVIIAQFQNKPTKRDNPLGTYGSREKALDSLRIAKRSDLGRNPHEPSQQKTCPHIPLRGKPPLSQRDTASIKSSKKRYHKGRDNPSGMLRDRDFRSIAIATTVIVGILLVRLIYACYAVVQIAIIDSNIEIAIGNLLVSLWRILGFPIALSLVTVAFSLIYQHGASVRIKNTPVFPGAILAAISWAIVSLLFRLYVLHIGIYNKIYGAVGTVVILMLWLYLSSLVMLIGEQVNVILGQAIANKRLPLK